MQQFHSKHRFSVEVRLTHKYIGQASWLDTWGCNYQFTALGSERVSTGNGYDDLGAHRFTVIGDKHRSQVEQASALTEHYSYNSRCTHNYDCCGCPHTSARVIPKGRGRFSVLVHGYRNC